MKYYAFLFFIVLISRGCRDMLEIPDTGRKIVINSLITNDSLLSVRIGYSAYILDSSTLVLTDLKDAEVNIYQNQICIDSLNYFFYGGFDYYDHWEVFIPGNYRSRHIMVQAGDEYGITVRAPGFPEATANTNIPEIVEIEQIDTSGIILPQGEFFSDNRGIICNIRFTDPSNADNYYLFNTCKIPSVVPFHNYIEFSSQDPVIEEILCGFDQEGVAFSDKVINGQTHTLTIMIKRESIDMIQSEDEFSISFRLYSITEEYFRYIRTLNLYSKNFGNPLADPVMMFSNVTGGYGMFTGASVSSASISLN